MEAPFKDQPTRDIPMQRFYVLLTLCLAVISRKVMQRFPLIYPLADTRVAIYRVLRSGIVSPLAQCRQRLFHDDSVHVLERCFVGECNLAGFAGLKF
jgi:hypothetical protein